MNITPKQATFVFITALVIILLAIFVGGGFASLAVLAAG